MTCAGKVVAGLLLVGLGYVDCTQPAVAIALLVLGVSIAGFQYSGFLVNHVDIAPAFAGILFGISNSIAAVTGFLSPVVVGIITEEVCCVCVCEGFERVVRRLRHVCQKEVFFFLNRPRFSFVEGKKLNFSHSLSLALIRPLAAKY